MLSLAGNGTVMDVYMMDYGTPTSVRYTGDSVALSVSDLTRCIRGVIEAEDLFRDVWVRGEISNFVKHSSGHRYFSMKDKSALIKCVIWANSIRSSRFEMADGMNVVARGRVSVYEKMGQYQLTVSEIVPDGAGALFLAYEQLKAKLQAEGLFDEIRKKQMPSLPGTLAIVTSPTAAALRDMVSIAKRRLPSVNLLLIPTLMQGPGAEASVVESLRVADSLPNVDVIVLGRGGGSIEDLWTFNTESVVRAIAACSKPVISAIGHETDYTLSDFAADLRAPTPSAAIELVLPDSQELLNRINGMTASMKSSLDSSLARKRTILDLLANSPSLKYPERLVQERSQSLDILSERMHNSFHALMVNREGRLSETVAKLQSLSPLGVLARGYGVVRRETDKLVVRSISDAAIGDRVETLISDGRLISEIIDVKEGWE